MRADVYMTRLVWDTIIQSPMLIPDRFVTLPESPTFAQVVRGVAQEFGRGLTEGDVEFILWEHTGYPDFWDGDPRECCERQARAFFEKAGV